MTVRDGLLRRDLEARGWNGRDLARATGLGQATIYRFLEKKVRTPKTLKRIAEALGYDTERYLR
jgi:transcriptional regulator with XRE-family HTH domain